MRNMYKVSQFCIIRKKADKYIVYNTLYNTLVKMCSEAYEYFSGMSGCPEALKNDFIRHGMWVPENVDERTRYLSLTKLAAKYYRGYKNITIATTMNCNARCGYCYENGSGCGNMTIADAVKTAEYIISCAENKELRINWFGGEPLMNPGVIDCISKALNCAGVPFTSYIITNGSLITEEFIQKMKSFWHVSDVQITIDGTEQVYEERKNYYDKEKCNYRKVLQNIQSLAKSGIYIHIRINIDSNNTENCCTLVRELDSLFACMENVSYYPAFISGTDKKLDENQRFQIVKKMISLLQKPEKMTTDHKINAFPKVFPCMYNDPNSLCIDINGNIHNCEHNIGDAGRAIGTLEKYIAGNEHIVPAAELRSECLFCEYLPKCMGGCHQENATGEISCFIDKYIISAYLDLLLINTQ